MIRKFLLAAPLALAALFGGVQDASAAAVVNSFEGFNDGDSITNQIAGMSFGHATVLVAGVSLNETAFPPHSGTHVLFDDGGPISIDFSSPVYSVAGYFTYAGQMTLSAYDSANQLLGSLLSSYGDNIADGTGDAGSSPNEFLSFGSAAGLISRVVISADPLGSSLVLDDLAVDFGTTNSVPEAGSLALVLLALAAVPAAASARRRASTRDSNLSVQVIS